MCVCVQCVSIVHFAILCKSDDGGIEEHKSDVACGRLLKQRHNV